MAQGDLRFRRTLTHTYKSMTKHHTGRKLFFWLAGLALATGSLTLAQADHTGANSAANSAHSASVRVSTTSTDNNPPAQPKTEVRVDSAQGNAGDDTDSDSSRTTVSVNGHHVSVPSNGSVHTTIPNEVGDGDSSVSVDIQNSSQGSASNQSNSSSQISIFSQSNTSSEVSSQ